MGPLAPGRPEAGPPGRSPVPDDLVPRWLARSAAVGWRLLAAAGVVIVGGLVVAAIPVSATATLVSLVFAAALAPTAMRLRARGLPRPVAAAVTFGAGAALIVGAAIVLLVLLLPDLRDVAGAAQAGLDAVRQELADAGAPETVSRLLDQLATSLRGSLTPDPGTLIGTAASVGTVIVLGTFLTYFLLADGDRGWSWLMRQLPAGQVTAISASATAGVERVAWYVRRTALLATVDAVAVGVVLTLLGVPLAGALACVAFLAGFVPYLGAVAGGMVIVLAALALGGTVPAVAVVAALVLAWVGATRLLEATAMSRRIDVHPLVVLVALPAGVVLFGVLGLLALLPVTVFGLAVSRSVIAALSLAPGTPADAAATADAPAAVGPAARDASPEVQVQAPAEPPGREAFPLWLERVAQWSWRALVLAALAGLAIVGVVRLSAVVVPGVIAIVGAATLLPLVDRLDARGWSRSVAAALATVGTMAFVGISVGAAVAMSLGPLGEVIDAAVRGASDVELAWLADWITQAGTDLQVNLAALFADLALLLVALVLAALMTFFLLRDGRGWWQAGLRRLSPGPRGPVAEAGGRAVQLLAGYMTGTAIISAFGGATTGLILAILGLPLVVPVTVIGFFTGFIPYVGSFITTAIALLVTIALGDTSDIVLMLVFTVVFNIAQGNFVTPLVYGRSLALHPAVVLMAIPVGNEVAGVLGMFLVVPAAATVAATWRLLIAAIAAPPATGSDDPGATAAPGEAMAPGSPSGTAGTAGDSLRPNLTPSDTNPPLPSGA